MNDCINTKEIIIDGADVTCREEFFGKFRHYLGESVLIGSNLDALHDALTSITFPTDITILSRPSLEESLGEYWDAAYSMLMDCLDENCELSLSFEAD